MTLVDIEAEVRQDRELSFMVYTGNDTPQGNEIWISLPKSQAENNDDGTFTMPEWLAIEKGLV